VISETKYILKYEKEALFNLYPYAVMVTLTSSENIIDGALFKNEFHRFMVYLKRYLNDSKLYYVVVREKQERGAYHYHVILFGYKFIPHEVIASLWRLGFVWVSMVTNEKAIAYILKYVRKGSQSGRLHSSYTLLAIFKEAYIAFRNYWRRSYFLALLLDYVSPHIDLHKLNFEKYKEWFYAKYQNGMSVNKVWRLGFEFLDAYQIYLERGF
jgi:hypothetical protein